MKGDFSRNTFKKNKHYSKVNLQQGRVQVDADWNEQVDIDQHHVRTSLSDIIGESGVPSNEKNGFRIKPTGNSYLINKGRYYVEGILCENERDCYVYEQPDLPPLGDNNPSPVKTGAHLVYLDVWERHITSLDDASIRETALGGPDTSTRTKIVWQVKALRMEDGDRISDICTSRSWLHLKEQTLGTLEGIVDKGGYRGLDNQLYRIEIHVGGNLNQATFKWSRNNGTIASKVESFNALENKISIYVDGKDHSQKFTPGQWIEIIDDRYELWGMPGMMFQIQNIEDNVISFDKDTFKGTLSASVTYPQEFNPKIRRWDSAGGFIPITADHYIDVEDGIQVKFSPGPYRTGDYWYIPARTRSGNIEWPRNGECPIPMPPTGIIHHYAPLALVKYDQNGIKLVTDYRNVFDTAASITNKLSANSGTLSIILQPMTFKIFGPIQHKCNSVNRNQAPPLVMLGLESYNSNTSLPTMTASNTVLHMDDLSTLTLISDRYGHIVADSDESEQFAKILGLDASLKPLSNIPPLFKPVLIDSLKFYILALNLSKIELKLNLKWWAITAKTTE
ncbi:MAG TPA: DUF6519 domain-containing protein [Nitrososphaeraceae archaeon]|nr:DUF6519 domain-containing protein [Nitrososphaeraceae archaeon]